MDIPEDVKRAASTAHAGWVANLKAVAYPTARDHEFYFLRHVEAAILAERDASEARMLELLKDPVAVRVNWMRGGIDASSIIAEVEQRATVAERERCAKVAAAIGKEYADPFFSPHIAAAIRNPPEQPAEL